LLSAHLVASNWNYYSVPLDAYVGQSVSLLLNVDIGVWIDDLAMGVSLSPESPDAQCLLAGVNPKLHWLPALNCLSYKVYQSSDLLSWELISPADYLDCSWTVTNPTGRKFFRVSGINGAQ